MGIKIRIKLDEVLKERNMTQRQLKEKVDPIYIKRNANRYEGKDIKNKGIRPAALSEIYNNQRTTVNREHLEIIAEALEITEISELIEIVNE